MSDELFCTIRRDDDPWYDLPWHVNAGWSDKRQICFTQWGARLITRRWIRKEIRRRIGTSKVVNPYRYPPEKS